MLKRNGFIKIVFVTFLFFLIGCAGSSNISKVAPEDKIIIDAGTEKAKSLGLIAVPFSGRYGGPGTFLMYTNENHTDKDLIINASQNDIILKGMIVVKRGQCARKINNEWKIVE